MYNPPSTAQPIQETIGTRPEELVVHIYNAVDMAKNGLVSTEDAVQAIVKSVVEMI
jgi:hypothetical protein